MKDMLKTIVVLSVLCALLGIVISILAGTPVGSTIVAVHAAVFGLSWIIGKMQKAG